MSFFDWVSTTRENNRKYDAVAASPLVLEAVKKRLVPSIDRVADIPLKCGSEATGLFVSLAIEGARVVTVYTRSPDMTGDHSALENTAALARGLDIKDCPVCHKPHRYSALNVLRAAYGAITGPSATRPSVQLHALNPKAK